MDLRQRSWHQLPVAFGHPKLQVRSLQAHRKWMFFQLGAPATTLVLSQLTQAAIQLGSLDQSMHSHSGSHSENCDDGILLALYPGTAFWRHLTIQQALHFSSCMSFELQRRYLCQWKLEVVSSTMDCCEIWRCVLIFWTNTLTLFVAWYGLVKELCIHLDGREN